MISKEAEEQGIEGIGRRDKVDLLRVEVNFVGIGCLDVIDIKMILMFKDHQEGNSMMIIIKDQTLKREEEVLWIWIEEEGNRHNIEWIHITVLKTSNILPTLIQITSTKITTSQ